MAEFRPAVGDQSAFREELLDAGALIASDAPGLYGRGPAFERVLQAVDARITRAGAADDAEQLRFPPVLPRRQLEAVGYLRTFPHLAGTIFTFEGDDAQAAEQAERAERAEDWSEYQSMSDLVLVPAACYPVYPAVARRGPLGAEGVTVDAGGSYVFRREPSGDPARMQMFHQREMVRIGAPEAVQAWRDAWRDRAIALLRGLGLDARFDVASDAFFGRAGRMLAANQRAQELKFEVLVPIAGPEPTAVASFNYHGDHFATTCGLRRSDEGPVHTACLGFGLERVTLALLRAHGLDVDAWPAEVAGELWG
jgi:seryl-tRNA synthetase